MGLRSDPLCDLDGPAEAHVVLDEEQPAPQAPVLPLNPGLVVREELQLVRGLPVEVPLVQVPRRQPIAPGEVLEQPLIENGVLVGLLQRHHALAKKLRNFWRSIASLCSEGQQLAWPRGGVGADGMADSFD